MKIFISHSAKQKLFVRELREELPPHVNLWIDERELLIGEDVEDTIQASIGQECDFFVLVIDHYAVKSGWVAREVEWALAREEELDRPFLLPIVLDKDALDELGDNRIARRQHLPCYDLSPSSIENVSNSLTSELFAWLAREREERKKAAAQPSSFDVIRKAEDVIEEIDRLSRPLVHTAREDNPLAVDELADALAGRGLTPPVSPADLKLILDRLQGRGKLSGVYYDGEVIYLSQERFSFKSQLRLDLKKRIARRAFRAVTPGSTVAIDGGSTTLEVTKKIADGLRGRTLSDLTVVTNSLLTAHHLLNTLSEMGTGDYNSVCKVFVMGGLCRPTSLTVISEAYAHNRKAQDDAKFRDSMVDLIEEVGGLDVCFVGTNGLYEDAGFAVHNPYEVYAKKTMIASSDRKIILADPSKFAISEPEPFAMFSDGLEVITSRSPDTEEALERFESLIEGTDSTLVVA
jgi:DeoR/GlpR family transcriptional regulator of sugar metabolism